MSLHSDAVQTLTAWSPPTTEQAGLREVYLAHLACHDDAMWRECHPDHLTASAMVVAADRRAVLLTLHRRLRKWLQLGGHCEPHDDTLAEAALREAVEESGVRDLRLVRTPALLSRHEVPCGPVRPAHHLDVQYVAIAPRHAVPQISDESDDVRWFDVDALPAVDESVRALVGQALRLNGSADARTAALE